MNDLLQRFSLVLGVIAIAVGLGLAVAWMRTPHVVAQPKGPPAAAQVLVAARAVPSGALLAEGDLAWRKLAPGAPAPAGAFVQGSAAKESLVGAAVIRALGAGEVVRKESVVQPNERNFLAATLGEGLRAVTISVEAPQSASGLVKPGDRVDVILVQEIGEGARRMAAETVLRNSRILAVGGALASEKSRPGGTGVGIAAEIRAPRTITLEATPYDAERLYLASRLGELQLALRGVGDIAEASTAAPVWAGEVSDAAKWRSADATQARAAPPAGRGRPAPAPAEPTVLILRGSAGAGAS